MLVYMYLVIRMISILDQIRAEEIKTLAKVSDPSKQMEFEMISQFKSECELNVVHNKRQNYKIVGAWMFGAIYLSIDSMFKNTYTAKS